MGTTSEGSRLHLFYNKNMWYSANFGITILSIFNNIQHITTHRISYPPTIVSAQGIWSVRSQIIDIFSQVSYETIEFNEFTGLALLEQLGNKLRQTASTEQLVLSQALSKMATGLLSDLSVMWPEGWKKRLKKALETPTS
jgi:hypothetical protein